MKHTKLIALLLFIGVFINTGRSQEKIGSKAPDFEGKTFKGKTVRLSDYLGKIVLIDFWASWCPPCREEMPALIKFYRSHKNNVEILAVNIDDHLENAEHFVDKLFPPPHFPLIEDKEKQIPALFNIEAMPTSIFIDKKGTIRYWHSGYKDEYQKEFEKELAQLSKEN